jgi:hypothetical protein
MYHVSFDGRYGNATMMAVMQLTVESWGNYLSVLTTDYRRVDLGRGLDHIKLRTFSWHITGFLLFVN